MISQTFTKDNGIEDERDIEEQWMRIKQLEGVNTTMSDEHYRIMVITWHTI